jgi:hypothetical protein
MDDVDPKLAERIKRSIASAIVEASEHSSGKICIRPEAADALIGTLIAMCGELELFDDPQQIDELAEAVAGRIRTSVRNLRKATNVPAMPLQ